MDRSRWRGSRSATTWYCIAVGLFFAVRAVTTLAGGASFSTPGTGWRALFQLVAVAVLAVGVGVPRSTRVCVVIVAAIYTVATIAEAFHGSDLFGAIPVDHRDRFVHPLVVVLAVVCLLIEQPGLARLHRGMRTQ